MKDEYSETLHWNDYKWLFYLFMYNLIYLKNMNETFHLVKFT